MNKFLISWLVLISFTVSAQAYQSTILDKPDVATIDYDEPDGYKSYTPTAQEIKIAETILAQAVKTNPKIKDMNNYTRQYTGLINPKGEKIIGINCFYSSNPDKMFPNWKKQFVMVLDGGANYFNIKINLTTGEYYDFWVNGEA